MMMMNFLSWHFYILLLLLNDDYIISVLGQTFGQLGSLVHESGKSIPDQRFTFNPRNNHDDGQDSSYREIEDDTPESRILNFIEHKKDLTVRPSRCDIICEPVEINVSYNIAQILGLSQSEETLSISGWFTFQWHDYRLKWNKTDFQGVDRVNMFAKRLWHPDIGMMNSKLSEDFDFSSKSTGRMKIYNTGKVEWYYGIILNVACPLDVTFFPFDFQTCFLIVVPWQSDITQIILNTPHASSVNVDNAYLPNSNVSEWEIQATKIDKKRYEDGNSVYQYIEIAINLKRQPLYFVVLVLVPFSMLSFLACLIFTLDDTGDRLSVALSLVLSMTMYVMIVSSNAPRSMRSIPVMGIFLLTQLGLLSISTLLAVINNKLHSSHQIESYQDVLHLISGTGFPLSFDPGDLYYREKKFNKYMEKATKIKSRNTQEYTNRNQETSAKLNKKKKKYYESDCEECDQVREKLWKIRSEKIAESSVTSAVIAATNAVYKSQRDMTDENLYQNTNASAVAARLAASAVTAALSKNKNFQRRNYETTPSSSEDYETLKKEKKSHQPYPYRDLASRLDCLEMILYLILSILNAITCLLVLPHLSQSYRMKIIN